VVTPSLLLLTDGRFPSGSYAHSGGLEARVRAGLDLADLPAFLSERLTTVTAPECALAVAAARAARDEDLPTRLALDAEAEARCPNAPLRTAMRRLGSQLLRSGETVWPAASTIGAYRAASDSTPRPVAFGVVAAATGLNDHECASAYLYEEAAMVVAAAIRLLPIDAADALRCLTDCQPSLGGIANDAVQSPASPRSLPATFAPAYELRALAHAGQEGRLFAT
jgi:urease accessory protein